MIVSTIISAYNQSAYIEKSIRSVLEQEYPRHEIIVVDNSSTDNTCEIVSRFGPQVHYIQNPNHGPSSARNRGLREATGEYVHFLDGDDWIMERMYSEFQKSWAVDPGVDVLVGGEVHYFEDKLPIYSAEASYAIEAPLPYLLSHHPWCIHAAIVKTDSARQIGGFDTALWACEDWDFWLKLAARGLRFKKVSGHYAVYRRRSGGQSSSYELMDQNTKIVLRRHARQSGSAELKKLASRCEYRSRHALWQSHMLPALGKVLTIGGRKRLAGIGACLKHNSLYSLYWGLCFGVGWGMDRMVNLSKRAASYIRGVQKTRNKPKGIR